MANTNDRHVDRVVTLRADRCVMHLNLPAVFELSTQANIIKILKLLFTHADVQECNRETIDILDRYIPEMIAAKKAVWGEASRTFQNEYSDPKSYTQRKAAAAVRAKNNRLFEKVTIAKREYEKACRVEKTYLETKAKYL